MKKTVFMLGVSASLALILTACDPAVQAGEQPKEHRGVVLDHRNPPQNIEWSTGEDTITDFRCAEDSLPFECAAVHPGDPRYDQVPPLSGEPATVDTECVEPLDAEGKKRCEIARRIGEEGR